MVVRDQPVSAPMHALASGLPASRVEAVALAHREASPEKTQANGLRFCYFRLNAFVDRNLILASKEQRIFTILVDGKKK